MQESIAFLLAFFLVTGVGLWMVGHLSEFTLWKRKTIREGERAPFAVQGGFPALDLGPDTMRWPSEVAVIGKRIALPDLYWPSEHWNDPHFGKGKVVPPPIEHPPTRPPEKAPVQQVDPPKQKGKKPNKDAPFTREEILRMVNEHGLAASVQLVRDRTGWDFQRAAKYLAKIVQPE